MSRPCHVQVFNKGLRSWRELPVRYAEFGACHRNEPSSSLHGLMRTRPVEQDTPMCSAERKRHWARCPLYRAPIPCLLRPRLSDYAMAFSTRPTSRLAPTNSGIGPRHGSVTRPANVGLLIPLNPARAPCTDPSSNSPCEIVMAARGTAPRFKWTACSPNAWVAPMFHHGVYQSYTYQPVNCAANHHWSHRTRVTGKGDRGSVTVEVDFPGPGRSLQWIHN
jgi:tRNA synthetase class II core domain (G, H, P, S and T)